tara:strand:+ start:228 stop:476 length:249 start_codon:yes stop_codon:yes gene_type:complete
MNIRISNLIDTATESDLVVLFKEYGIPCEVRIVEDRYAVKSLVIVYLKLQDDNSAEKAIAALNGKVIGGEVISVGEAMNYAG